MAISFPFSIIPIYQKETLPKTYRNIAFQLNIFLCWLITPARALFVRWLGWPWHSLCCQITTIGVLWDRKLVKWKLSHVPPSQVPQLTRGSGNLTTSHLMRYQHLNCVPYVAHSKGEYELVVPLTKVISFLCVCICVFVFVYHLATQVFVPQNESKEEKIRKKGNQCDLTRRSSSILS